MKRLFLRYLLLSFFFIISMSFIDSANSAITTTKEQQSKMTPEAIVKILADGNKRFLSNNRILHDYRAQQKNSKNAQYPVAIVHSCIDSRVPIEIILDTGIGTLFSSRIAGNVDSKDVVAGMEFASALSGAKVILVMGHTKCGAVKGAIADAKLGNLTSLLNNIKPAIAKTVYKGKRTADNYDFVDAVTKQNVLLTLDNIRKDSKVLLDLEKEGKIKILGAMYNIATGKVTFL